MIALLFFFIVFTNSIVPSEITITQSGIYEIGSDIIFSPTVSNDAIIIINSDNVVVDLSGNVIQQGNSTTNISGIEITSGRSNITIKNGIIENVTGSGVSVADNCSNIQIQGISFSGCQTRGIEVIGAGTTENCSIIDCTLLNCCSGASGDVSIYLDDVARFQLQQCVISGCGNASNAFSGVYLNSCTDCNLFNITVVSSSGSSIIGVDIVTSSQCLFRQLTIQSNSPATGGTFRGIDLSGTSNKFHVFERCLVTFNSSTAGCIGFYLEANSQNNVFRRCSALNNSGGDVDGFALTGGTANNFENSFIFCSASYNAATGSGNQANGWRIEGSDYGSLLDSIAAENTSSNSIATGLTFISPGGNNWTVKGNQFNRNVGSSNSNSFGIRRLSGSTNLFQQNNAFNNGTGGATSNQFYGLSSSSVLSRTSSNMNYYAWLGNVAIPY